MDMNVHSLGIAFLLVFCLLFRSSEQQSPRVETKLGAILGKERTSETGKKIYSFTGIPYIKPPLEELRFKPPVPAEPFVSAFNATNEWIACVQNISGYYLGAEDCVILNVFTPWDPSSPKPEKPLSVMVYIHYGAFIAGSSLSMVVGMPDYLLERDVILVTLNFRIGVFGFLSTGDEVAPGNYGLLDIVEGLRWIKNNIAAFGGDPDRVTVFGDNSGAIISHFLMLSPLAKGLFHGAIAQSGNALTPWARTNVGRRDAKKLAEKLGCPISPSSEMVECLRGKPTEELVKTDVIDKEKRYSEYFPLVWAPRIDREAVSPFLPEHPVDVMTSGNYNKVPLIIGHTKDEMDVELFGPAKDLYVTDDDRKHGFLITCPAILTGDVMTSNEKVTGLCNQLLEYYLTKQENTTEDNIFLLSELFSDMLVRAGVYKSIELMADHSPVYSYSFNYDNGKTWLMAIITNYKYQYQKGLVGHMDDLLYLFKYPATNWTTASPEYKMVEAMTTAWTEFAKTGKPVLPTLNEPWPRATSQKSKYVVIDSVPTIEEDYRPEDMEFVNNIFSETLYQDFGELSVAPATHFNVALIVSTFMMIMFLN